MKLKTRAGVRSPFLLFSPLGSPGSPAGPGSEIDTGQIHRRKAYNSLHLHGSPKGSEPASQISVSGGEGLLGVQAVSSKACYLSVWCHKPGTSWAVKDPLVGSMCFFWGVRTSMCLGWLRSDATGYDQPAGRRWHIQFPPGGAGRGVGGGRNRTQKKV